ncbi:MAG: HipA domain-containing protein [Microthrixaceae bacterium]
MADAAEAATQAYVWAWLPDAVDPVLAGRIDREGPLHTFTYGRSYLAREQAMPLYLPELPLVERIIQPLTGEIAGCLRDAAPDGWGQRVIENAHVSAGGTHALGVLDYLLRSSANRIGALGFSRSVDAPPSSGERGASLDELVASAERVEAGEPLDPDLDRALLHGTSVGGARPKALLSDGDRSLIAKFSSSSDSRPVVKAEFVAMTLAKRAGLTVAPVGLVAVQHRDVLLVERFDRTPDGGRRALVSALTVLGLDEFGGRYATYWELADSIPRDSPTPTSRCANCSPGSRSTSSSATPMTILETTRRSGTGAACRSPRRTTCVPNPGSAGRRHRPWRSRPTASGGANSPGASNGPAPTTSTPPRRGRSSTNRSTPSPRTGPKCATPPA